MAAQFRSWLIREMDYAPAPPCPSPGTLDLEIRNRDFQRFLVYVRENSVEKAEYDGMISRIRLHQARKRLAELGVMLGESSSHQGAGGGWDRCGDAEAGGWNDSDSGPFRLRSLSDPMAEAVDRIETGRRELEGRAVGYAEAEHEMRNSAAALSLLNRFSGIVGEASAHAAALCASTKGLGEHGAQVEAFLTDRLPALQREREALGQQFASLLSRLRSLAGEPQHDTPASGNASFGTPLASGPADFQGPITPAPAAELLPFLSRLHREHVETALAAVHHSSELQARRESEATLTARLFSLLLPGTAIEGPQAAAVSEGQIRAGTNLGVYLLRLKIAGDKAATLITEHALENLRGKRRLVESAKLEAREMYKETVALRGECESALEELQDGLAALQEAHSGLARMAHASPAARNTFVAGGEPEDLGISSLEAVPGGFDSANLAGRPPSLSSLPGSTSGSRGAAVAGAATSASLSYGPLRGSGDPFSATLSALRAVLLSLAKASAALGVLDPNRLACCLKSVLSDEEARQIVSAAWGSDAPKPPNLRGRVATVLGRGRRDASALPQSPPRLSFLALHAISGLVDAQDLAPIRRNSLLTDLRALYKTAIAVDVPLYRDIFARFGPAGEPAGPSSPEALGDLYELARGRPGPGGIVGLGHIDQRSPTLFQHTESAAVTQLLLLSHIERRSQEAARGRIASLVSSEDRKAVYADIRESLKDLSACVVSASAGSAKAESVISGPKGDAARGFARQTTDRARAACLLAGLREIGITDSLGVTQECSAGGILPVLKYLDILRAVSAYFHAARSIPDAQKRAASLRERYARVDEERERREFVERISRDGSVQEDLSQILAAAKSLLSRFEREVPA